MAQVEDPANLDRWGNPAYRLLTVILIRCGLRISSAVTLPWDCVVTDADGAPYLRYYNTKMKREALVPIDDELRAMIGAQHDRIRLRWPDGTPVLFPGRTPTSTGPAPSPAAPTAKPSTAGWTTATSATSKHGQPVHLTPHQWRHILSAYLPCCDGHDEPASGTATSAPGYLFLAAAFRRTPWDGRALP